MTVEDTLEHARSAFARRAWGAAYESFSGADGRSPLEPDDLERLATAAYLTGRDSQSEALRARAHRLALERDQAERAARCAFWLGIALLLKGEMARGSGWLARAQRVLDERQLDCVERGYLLVPAGLHSEGEGDVSGAHGFFLQAVDVAERFGDPDLMALGRLGCGTTLIALGQTAQGLTLLDEVMVAVTADDVSPVVAGIVYCAVILACRDSFDLRRAQEWTAALHEWCASQPDLAVYRGQCLVHRSEIMQLRGSWPEAIEEARRARERLSQPPQPAVGMAFYQEGELHRLQGRFGEAEEAYRRANQHGRSPQPGLAQLRLAQGRIDDAAAAMRRVAGEERDRVTRSKLLGPYVEIMLAGGDVQAARAGVDELSGIAAESDMPLLHAVSAQASGRALLAEGDARAACDLLRRAWSAWQELEVPYEAARTRVLIALACRDLGDHDSVAMELDAARWTFHQLGAAPDLARLEELSREGAPRAGGLTAREVEVLVLVATGKTNRQIAQDLVISEKTVARHMSNIFTKLGVASRAAATAYAYEHDLV